MSPASLQQISDRLRRERRSTLELIGRLTPPDLERVSAIRGRTVRGMLWMMEEHYRVHRTQIHNNRVAAEERPTEIHSLLSQAQASFEAMLTLLIGLSEDATDATPAEGEWSVRQVLQHLLEFELRYQTEFQRLLAETEARA